MATPIKPSGFSISLVYGYPSTIYTYTHVMLQRLVFSSFFFFFLLSTFLSPCHIPSHLRTNLNKYPTIILSKNISCLRDRSFWLNELKITRSIVSAVSVDCGVEIGVHTILLSLSSYSPFPPFSPFFPHANSAPPPSLPPLPDVDNCVFQGCFS